MKKLIFAGITFLFLTILLSFTLPSKKSSVEAIKWYSWEEAVAANDKKPKKLFVDVYTNWCGWCKKMDRTTFQDPKVAAYLNKNFYPVKFNAEQRETIKYKGHSLEYRSGGRRGVHELAMALLDQRLSYPSYVYLNETQEKITVSPGYKTADALIRELEYIADEHYKNSTFEQFLKSK